MRKRGAIFSASAAVAAALVAFGIGKAESHCQTQQDAYRTEAAKQHPSGYVTEFALDRAWLPCLVERVTADPQPREASDQQKRDLAAQEAVAGAAFWVGVIAFLQLIATVLGLLYIRGTLKASLLAVEDTSEATEAMKLQNEIAEDTAQRQLRAYVIAKDQAVTNMKAGQEPVFICKLDNSGQTPAYEVRCIASAFFTVEEPDTYRVMFRDKPKGKHSKDTIGGGDFKVLPISSQEPLSEFDLSMIYSGRVTAIFAGIISYRDAFKRRRLSTFKYYLPLKPSGSDVVDMISCGTGNYAN